MVEPASGLGRSDGVADDATHTYVFGWGHNGQAGRDEALLWRRRS